MPKVLIIDDSFVMRTLIRDILSSEPQFNVVGDASDGKEALDKVKVLEPDLIFLDIEMPVMDGLEFLKRYKLMGSAKVIIVSSVAQLGSKKAIMAKAMGAFEVIAKPSGAMSLDLKTKKGHEIVKAALRAVN